MRIFIILLFAFSFYSCQQSKVSENLNPSENVSITDFPEWAKDATIYEVNMRQFTEEGTFEAFTTHLPRIKDMGIDIIWLMPIQPISKVKMKEPLGSPYSVADYKGVNPEYGNVEDFEAMVNKIHDLDMKIIIDWVPNHTGWDNAWITDHPEWYTQNDEGEIIDPIDYNTGISWGWTDVADLNFDNKDMREEMLNSLKFWLQERNIDGFRMDVAHGVPDDFWIATNSLLKEEGDIFLLAEGEVPKQRNLGGFHADYGWTFHHILNDIAKGKANVDSIWQYWEVDQKKFNKGFHMNFTSNHDENSWQGTVFERMGEAHKTMAVVVSTFDGMPLIYGGQEEPMKKRLAFFERDPINFKDYAYQEFYTELMTLKKRNPALFNGEFGGAPERISDSSDILAFKRTKGDNEVYAFINLSKEEKSISLPKGLDQSRKKIASETGIKINVNQITLSPWAYVIYAD